jgi:L-fuculose-phosphate aldolase
VVAAKQQPGEQISEMMKRIWHAGMTTASGGNISVRDSEGNIWTTPKGIDKGSLTDDDIVCVTPECKTENRFGYLPTSELSFHQAVYRKRKDLNAIIHAHPPALVSFSFARIVPETNVIFHAREICGKAGFAPYHISGSEELAESISEEFRKGHNCVIMENHATVVGGSALAEAFQRFEAFEFCARTIINANKINKSHPIPESRIEEVKQMRPALPVLDEVQYPAEELEIRQSICKFVIRACRQQLMLSSFGTLSVRWKENDFLITPHGVDRAKINPDDVVHITAGKKEPGKSPDESALLHLEIYKNHPHINSIFTSIAPYIMAYGVSGVPMDIRTSPEGYVLLRNMSVVPFGCRWNEVNRIVNSLSEETPSVLVENDIFLVTGKSILQAFERLEVAEFTAKSLIDTIPIGRPEPIEDHNLSHLRKKFLS